MAEAFLYGHQQFAQLLALSVVEADEQRILGLALRIGGIAQTLLAGGRQRDEVATSILGIALTGDQTFGFQGIEQRHEDARVGGHRLPQLGLAHRSVIVQQAEDVELTRREAARRMCVA
jgi:hypothetical protein